MKFHIRKGLPAIGKPFWMIKLVLLRSMIYLLILL